MASENGVKQDSLYREIDEKTSFPRVIRVKRIADMGSTPYVFYVAVNNAAMAAHPNGGFMPLDSFSTLWIPYKDQ